MNGLLFLRFAHKPKNSDTPYRVVGVYENLIRKAVNVEDAQVYIPIEQENIWFYISDVSDSIEIFPSAESIYKAPVITADELLQGHYRYLCYVLDGMYYMYRLTWRDFVNDEVRVVATEDGEYRIVHDAIGFRMKPRPDAIYDPGSDRIIFQSLRVMYSMIPGFDQLLQTGRQEAVQKFLDTGMVQFAGRLDEKTVTKSNLRHFASSADTIRAFSEEERQRMVQYITEMYGGELYYNPEKQSFTVTNNLELKRFIYAVEERIYTSYITRTKRVARSIAVIEGTGDEV